MRPPPSSADRGAGNGPHEPEPERGSEHGPPPRPEPPHAADAGPSDADRRRQRVRDWLAATHALLAVAYDVLESELRFVARHVRGFYPAVATALLVAFAFSIVAALAFAALSHLVARGMTQAFDEWVLRNAAALRTPRLNDIMLEITSLGNGSVLIALVATAAVFLWLTRHRLSVLFLCIGTIGGLLLNSVLKDFFDRPRPSVVAWETTVGSESFPSGHAMSAMIVYGSVAYLVGRLEPTPMLRRTTWALAALIILLIGVSRIYLGVHYPSDVLAGYVAGLAWTGFVITGINTVRFFAGRKPEVERAEKDLHAEEERMMGLRK